MPDTLIPAGSHDTRVATPATVPLPRVLTPALVTWVLLAVTQLLLFAGSLIVNFGAGALMGQGLPLPAAWLPAWAVSGGVHALSVLAVIGLMRSGAPTWYSPLLSSLSVLLAVFNLTGALAVAMNAT